VEPNEQVGGRGDRGERCEDMGQVPRPQFGRSAGAGGECCQADLIPRMHVPLLPAQNEWPTVALYQKRTIDTIIPSMAHGRANIGRPWKARIFLCRRSETPSSLLRLSLYAVGMCQPLW
jgi:hypothetical protein